MMAASEETALVGRRGDGAASPAGRLLAAERPRPEPVKGARRRPRARPRRSPERGPPHRRRLHRLHRTRSRTSPCPQTARSPARSRRSSWSSPGTAPARTARSSSRASARSAKKYDATMTYFLSGVYLLPEEKRDPLPPAEHARRRAPTSAISRTEDIRATLRAAARGLARRQRDRHPLQRPLLRPGRRRQLVGRGVEERDQPGQVVREELEDDHRAGRPTRRCPSTTTRN